MTKQANDKKIVLNYLTDNFQFDNKSYSLTRLIELVECYDDIPEEVEGAFGRLSNYEYWEVVRQFAVEGKKQSVEG